jgi:hypothetical protein
MDEPSTCRGCGQEIVFARLPSGKQIPLDPDPRPDGNVVLAVLAPGQEMQVRVLRKGEEVPELAPRYVSHFSTCPHAGEFRRSRKQAS